MKYLICDFYDDFKCVGDQCPQTCCAGGWDIIIDEDTKKVYDSVDGAFGQTLKENMHPYSHSRFAFSLTANGRCPFLTQENLCEIYIKLGPDNMCSTCRHYPRITSEYGDVTFATLTLSCPEVSRMLLTRTTPISFLFNDAEVQNDKEISPSFDWAWFNTLMSSFILNIELLQNRDYSLSTRLRLLLIFNSALQTLCDSHTDPAPLIESFSSPDFLSRQAAQLDSLPSNIPAVFSAFLHFYQHTSTLNYSAFLSPYTQPLTEFINSASGEKLISRVRDCLQLLSDPIHDMHYEHLCVYFLFRYYFHAYESKKPLEQVAQLLYLLLVYRGYALPFCSSEEGISTERQILLFSTISRVFDHNIDNLKILSSYFEKNGQASIDFLLTLI